MSAYYFAARNLMGRGAGGEALGAVWSTYNGTHTQARDEEEQEESQGSQGPQGQQAPRRSEARQSLLEDGAPLMNKLLIALQRLLCRARSAATSVELITADIIELQRAIRAFDARRPT